MGRSPHVRQFARRRGALLRDGVAGSGLNSWGQGLNLVGRYRRPDMDGGRGGSGVRPRRTCQEAACVRPGYQPRFLLAHGPVTDPGRPAFTRLRASSRAEPRPTPRGRGSVLCRLGRGPRRSPAAPRCTPGPFIAGLDQPWLPFRRGYEAGWQGARAAWPPAAAWEACSGRRRAGAAARGGQVGRRRARSGARHWARADGYEARPDSMTVPWAGTGWPVSTQEARTSQAMPWLVPLRPHWPRDRNAGRHESSEQRPW